MMASTKVQAEGTLHEVKGAVKEAAGEVTSDPDLKNEGHAERLAGKMQKKVGQVTRVLEQ